MAHRRPVRGPAQRRSLYLARISIPEQEAARLGEDQVLRPGIPADVMIKTGERTALDYLIQPIRDSVMRAWRETETAPAGPVWSSLGLADGLSLGAAML